MDSNEKQSGLLSKSTNFLVIVKTVSLSRTTSTFRAPPEEPHKMEQKSLKITINLYTN